VLIGQSRTAKAIILVGVRIVLLIFGYFIFVLSFFYGLDVNVGTVVGIAMLVTAVVKYVPKARVSMMSGLSLTIVTASLYTYYLHLTFMDSEAVQVTDVIYLLPLACLGLLIFNFSIMVTVARSDNNT